MLSDPNAAGRPAQRATRIVFFIAGFGMAGWAPLVPFAKARADMDDAMLGLLLLCLGAGSIVTMSMAGALAARFGCRRVIVASVVPLCIALPLLASLSNPMLLAAALLVFGASLGAIDVTMNIQAIVVERASGRAMMSGFHGLFSLGGIAGPACIAAPLSAGASPLAASLCLVVAMLVMLAVAASHLLPHGNQAGGPVFAVPHGVVLFIGILCFIAFLAEGSMLDWSAVFLTSVHSMQPAYAGLGYATFSVTMTTGRLTGDRLVQRFGSRNIVVFGGLCGAAGFAIATLVPYWQITLLGYALIGAGCSNIVPVLYSSVGRQTVMPEYLAVPAVTILGYAGILAGPAAIGFLAHLASLSAAFLILALLQLGIAASGRLLRV